MKTMASHMIEHFALAVTAVAGIAALALAWKSKDGIAVAVRASYFNYGMLFVVGALAYFTKPRIGSAILILALLSAPVVAALVGFPVWVNGLAASRIGSIVGAIISAGIGSYGIGRVIDASRSPSPDPRRSAKFTILLQQL